MALVAPRDEKRVEEGVPPESIVMTKSTDDGKTEWTRPVCVYPNVAKYKGSGDFKDATNWTCGAWSRWRRGALC